PFGKNCVKQILTILFSLLFQFNAISAVLADCFRHSHGVVEENHHDGTTSDVTVHSGSDHDDSVPRIHCAPLRFDIESLNSLSARLSTKPQVQTSLGCGYIVTAIFSKYSESLYRKGGKVSALHFSHRPFAPSVSLRF